MGKHVLPVAQICYFGRLELLPGFQCRVDSRVNPALVQPQLNEFIRRASDQLSRPIFEQIGPDSPREQLHGAPLLPVRFGDLRDHPLRQRPGRPLRRSRQRTVGQGPEDHVGQNEEAEQRPGNPCAKRSEELSPVNRNRKAKSEDPQAQYPQKRNRHQAEHQQQDAACQHD